MIGKRISRRAGVIGAVTVLALAGAGVAMAATSGGPVVNGVIQGCYSTASGSVRVILPSQNACSKGQAPLTWNQTGPQGPAGPVGATGAQGPAGPIGPVGPTGATGDTGPAGATGDAGATGPAGSAGPAGTNGVSGYNVVTSGGNTAGGFAQSKFAANCPSGDVVIGGGWETTSGGGIALNGDAPGPDIDSSFAAQSWAVDVYNGGALNATIAVYAICADAA
jgi:hypothetical protein